VRPRLSLSVVVNRGSSKPPELSKSRIAPSYGVYPVFPETPTFCAIEVLAKHKRNNTRRGKIEK
jgi:hypothetical protein